MCVPRRFVRSGNVNLNNGYLRSAGLDGNYWSSTAASEATKSYFLNFNASGVNPSNLPSWAARYNGFSVRCRSFALRCRSLPNHYITIDFLHYLCYNKGRGVGFCMDKG